MEPRFTVSALRDHLRILKNENRATETGDSFAVYFEGSALCCRSPFFSCRSSRCVLMQFVPEEYRGEAVPCRYIRLNDEGETLQSFYEKAKAEQTAVAVRSWLASTIASLDSDFPQAA